MVDTLLQLRDNGTLNHLVQIGLLSPKVLTYLEIYLWIDARLKTSNKSLNTLVLEAQDTFNVSRATIWRSLKFAKDDNPISR